MITAELRNIDASLPLLPSVLIFQPNIISLVLSCLPLCPLLSPSTPHKKRQPPPVPFVAMGSGCHGAKRFFIWSLRVCVSTVAWRSLDTMLIGKRRRSVELRFRRWLLVPPSVPNDPYTSIHNTHTHGQKKGNDFSNNIVERLMSWHTYDCSQKTPWTSILSKTLSATTGLVLAINER